ncbi:type II secretion system F family protein [Caldisalinibacter kiritimatiensis]|uniref:Type IV fimbrial assembly protein PilC n=1 Tax=Caldisalinibacter kiritimatiensis TaxID=1304284 RepID=R1CN31_9FIRM|nr:type II secretion system F family protein [Caldisalinibacter kiritimatiensis]EOD00111.1 Type IV fimbrial assembly protein PilC [Caldisalinibacter kiritimatiensis]
MPTYKYKAIKVSGDRTTGTFTANSKREVVSMLKEKNYYPVEIKEVVEAKNIEFFSFLNKVKTKDIAIFCRQFYTMLDAGVTIINCLDILSKQTENKKLRQEIIKIYDEVQKGLTLSEALKKHNEVFPDLLINMVEAGEVSGNLDVIMDRMAIHYEKENKISNKVKSAMVYPIILSIISLVVVIFLLTVVMPNFISMFEGTGVELPLPTRILLDISDGIKKTWYIIALFLFILGYIFNKYKKSERGKRYFDNLKFKIPIVKNTTEKVVTSRFTRTLSTLLGSGVSLIQSLDIVANVVGNKVVADGILQAKEDVRKGISLAEPIKNIRVFPPMVVSMIMIGEESGSLEEILDKTADFYDDEVEAAMEKMTTALEPLMIVFMAIIIGAIVIAMVLPMFNMVNTLQF